MQVSISLCFHRQDKSKATNLLVYAGRRPAPIEYSQPFVPSLPESAHAGDANATVLANQNLEITPESGQHSQESNANSLIISSPVSDYILTAADLPECEHVVSRWSDSSSPFTSFGPHLLPGKDSQTSTYNYSVLDGYNNSNNGHVMVTASAIQERWEGSCNNSKRAELSSEDLSCWRC